MLYIIDNINLLDDDFPERKKSLLSKERQIKSKRLRSLKNKKASVAAYLLLRIALKEMYEITDIVEFSYEDKGKPLLRDYPGVHFNLSHSGNIAACIVADNKVGVDVQQITAVSEKVAKRVLTKAEFAEYKNSQTPDEYFCKVWTIKESFLKYSGQGITMELKEISADTLQDTLTFKGEGYFCSVYGAIMKEIQIKRIGREDFEQLSS